MLINWINLYSGFSLFFLVATFLKMRSTRKSEIETATEIIESFFNSYVAKGEEVIEVLLIAAQESTFLSFRFVFGVHLGDARREVKGTNFDFSEIESGISGILDNVFFNGSLKPKKKKAASRKWKFSLLT